MPGKRNYIRGNNRTNDPMSKIPFRKYHGFGNDYFVAMKPELDPVRELGEFARAICRRNTGAGSDGLAILDQVEGGQADYACRIINPDGTEAGFSGNGTRCAAAHLYRKKLWSEKNLRLGTKSGIKNYEFQRLEDGKYWFLAEIGHPSFEDREIPFVRSERKSEIKFEDASVSFDGEQLPVCLLNVGNPVCAVFVDGFDFDWRRLGAGIEGHEFFPERTNVVFVAVDNDARLRIKIWERGAGETASSGTCSVAAAVAAAHTGRAGRSVSVVSDGGITEARWRDDGEMLITGSAEYVYSGFWPVTD